MILEVVVHQVGDALVPFRSLWNDELGVFADCNLRSACPVVLLEGDLIFVCGIRNRCSEGEYGAVIFGDSPSVGSISSKRFFCKVEDTFTPEVTGDKEGTIGICLCC